jgi:hypothetical protein
MLVVKIPAIYGFNETVTTFSKESSIVFIPFNDKTKLMGLGTERLRK